ncbi:MAG: PAS domain-containing protein [Bacteroidaceae bacterium]|nr:PAS domain-containing protein [Bacteroidaceae bacterium]
MRLKHLFYILALLQVVILAMLFYSASQSQNLLFYIGEGVVVLVLVFLVYFYYKVLKPLDAIGNGMDLLNEQDFSSRLKPVGQQESDRIVSVFNKMMDQLKEEKLHTQEQNRFLDLLISASPMGVIILDFDGQITMMNDAALRILEVNDVGQVLHQPFKHIDSPLAQEMVHIPLGKAETIRLSDSMIYRCSHLSFMDRGFPHPFLLIESLTDEVMKAEKKAYEKVIRMIAHEVNNTVAGVTSAIDSVNDALADIPNTEDLREVMASGSERCLGMSHFITRFADVVKIPEPQLQEVDLNQLLLGCKSFMESICVDKNILINMQLCKGGSIAHIDPILFEQVLVNIVKNAAESIEADGVITITTQTNSIEIADNGKGISLETEKKLFTPFFSTKPNGQGIGLVFIREVLMKHGCTFSLRTYPDGLTRFKIRF